MSNALKCTVIIPTYNRAGLLRHTLGSLTRQSLPRDQFEVVVVDDGSTDNTPAVVDSFRERLNVRYFFQEDQGFRVAKARNVGITHAAADVCVFIDSGVLLHSDCLRAHVASHQSADEPVAVCGYVYCLTLDNEDAELINQTIDFENPDASIERLRDTGQWLDVREGFYAIYTDDFHDVPAPWLVFWTLNVSARTAQLRSVGMFDEAFRSWGGEDADLGYRLHRDGARFVLCREASAIHAPHAKNFDHNLAVAEANYRYMAKKYGTPIVELLVSVPPEQFFEINNIIRERELPSCADYLARQRAG
jgi:glycosyltransferase involved in cell wall biosynthesis